MTTSTFYKMSLNDLTDLVYFFNNYQQAIEKLDEDSKEEFYNNLKNAYNIIIDAIDL